MFYFFMRNRSHNYKWYTGLATRGFPQAAAMFWLGYYYDRYEDMKHIGRYKVAVDYLRESGELLEAVVPKKYGDRDMLVPWYPNEVTC